MKASSVAVDFGEDGNAVGFMLNGWSSPEPGFCWTIGLESVLSLPRPSAAGTYALSLTLWPHVRDETLPKQALIVAVNDLIVSVSEVVQKVEINCEVPRFAIEMADEVVVRLIHPHAASPRAVAELPDDRELALAVERLELRCSEVSGADEERDALAEESNQVSARRKAAPPMNVQRRY